MSATFLHYSRVEPREWTLRLPVFSGRWPHSTRLDTSRFSPVSQGAGEAFCWSSRWTHRLGAVDNKLRSRPHGRVTSLPHPSAFSPVFHKAGEYFFAAILSSRAQWAERHWEDSTVDHPRCKPCAANPFTNGSMQYRNNPEQAISCADREGNGKCEPTRTTAARHGQSGLSEVPPVAMPHAAFFSTQLYSGLPEVDPRHETRGSPGRRPSLNNTSTMQRSCLSQVPPSHSIATALCVGNKWRTDAGVRGLTRPPWTVIRGDPAPSSAWLYRVTESQNARPRPGGGHSVLV